MPGVAGRWFTLSVGGSRAGPRWVGGRLKGRSMPPADSLCGQVRDLHGLISQASAVRLRGPLPTFDARPPATAGTTAWRPASSEPQGSRRGGSSGGSLNVPRTESRDRCRPHQPLRRSMAGRRERPQGSGSAEAGYGSTKGMEWPTAPQPGGPAHEGATVPRRATVRWPPVPV